MDFDDSFFQLTSSSSEKPKPKPVQVNNDSPVPSIYDGNTGASLNEYSNTTGNYFIESDIIIPKIQPAKAESSTPLILVIDDDFETLDLLKIYFARGYEYVPFSGPREAIFYLNEHIPNLILLDCYIHTIKAARVVDIIRSYSDLKEVPIIYLCDDYERGAIESKLPEGVSGVLQRPVSRGDLQAILDKFFPKSNK